MDAMVSARVPVAVKERAGAILADIGATPSQLINAAYDYLLAHHELPGAKEAHEIPQNMHRMVTKAQLEEVNKKAKAMYVGDLPQGKTYEQLRDEAWEDRYARSA